MDYIRVLLVGDEPALLSLLARGVTGKPLARKRAERKPLEPIAGTGPRS